MSLIKENCIEFRDKRAKCIAKENGKKFTLINKSAHFVSKVRIDGCVIVGKTKKCDFLFKVESLPKNRALFIELKGGALNDSINQILATVKLLKGELVGMHLDARIVSSGNVPDLKYISNYYELNKILQKTGGNIDRRTLNYIETC